MIKIYKHEKNLLIVLLVHNHSLQLKNSCIDKIQKKCCPLLLKLLGRNEFTLNVCKYLETVLGALLLRGRVK